MDPNRRFAELARICWHEYDTETLNCIHCKEIMWRKDSKNLDYAADPREVLKVMVEREDWPEFLDTLRCHAMSIWDDVIPVSFILIPGKFRDVAVEFMERRKG